MKRYTQIKEGLQNHVNTVLIDADPDFKGNLDWSNKGLHIRDKSLVDSAIEILDDSGEFGPARYKNGYIEFGVFKDYYKGDYNKYIKDFKSGKNPRYESKQLNLKKEDLFNASQITKDMVDFKKIKSKVKEDNVAETIYTIFDYVYNQDADLQRAFDSVCKQDGIEHGDKKHIADLLKKIYHLSVKV